MGEEEIRLPKRKMIQTYWMECIVAIAMYAIAWPFACSRNGDSWREAERDDTDGGHLSRCTREKYRPMRMENILLGVGPILMIEVERDLTFDDCQSMRDAISLSGRKTESYFTDTNLIKTCKLLNLFRYHCNAPSLASEASKSTECIWSWPNPKSLSPAKKTRATYVDVRGDAISFATWRVSVDRH